MIVMVITLVMEMDQKMLLIRMVNPMAVILALVVTMNTKGCQGQKLHRCRCMQSQFI